MKIEDLVGHEMSALCYVRDYLEFHFDGPIVRFFVHPQVLWNKNEVNSGTECHETMKSLIGCKVISLDLNDDQLFEMTFEQGITIKLSLDGHQKTEVMHFVRGAGKPIDVW